MGLISDGKNFSGKSSKQMSDSEEWPICNIGNRELGFGQDLLYCNSELESVGVQSAQHLQGSSLLTAVAWLLFDE